MIIRLADEKKKLDTVFVTDFGDSYHQELFEPKTELEERAFALRNKYKDPVEYIIAKATYKQYMNEVVYPQYITKQMAKEAIAQDMTKVYIPPKPSMKRGTEAYKLMKKGIFSSPTNWKKIDQHELFSNLTEDLQARTEYTGPSYIRGTISNKKFNKLMDGVVISNNTGTESQLNQNRMKTDADLINEYFERKARKNGTVKKVEDTNWDPEPIAVSDIMDDKFYNNLMKAEEDDTPIFANGRYMTKSEREEDKIYEVFHDVGWDTIKLMKMSGSRLGEESRIAKITKKREKKLKKRKKGIDKQLMGAVGKKGYNSFEAYEEQMLGFTFRD